MLEIGEMMDKKIRVGIRTENLYPYRYISKDGTEYIDLDEKDIKWINKTIKEFKKVQDYLEDFYN